jgi:hypothetical protein
MATHQIGLQHAIATLAGVTDPRKNCSIEFSHTLGCMRVVFPTVGSFGALFKLGFARSLFLRG